MVSCGLIFSDLSRGFVSQHLFLNDFSNQNQNSGNNANAQEEKGADTIFQSERFSY